MKRYILLFAVLLSGFFCQAQSKVGTIDAEYILAQMPEIATVDEGLKTYNTELQEELQKTIQKYEKMVADYQATTESSTQEEKTSKENEIIGLENEIKNFRQKASVLLQMKRNELTKPLYAKIDEAMRQVIIEQKYTQVINSSANALAYADPAYDITEAVISKLGITVKQ
ncbi:OmpH family outer membrane protein [Antarcticibacterium sp. 1MA-6-2]|uniref:OmpH family outer membrane protein n=1 Tax=Antarcticibacterium sp. 1MA-6-2 TaxID=2908210 RepID=UPI001F320190|nr:OmpH family outer membrane protein [Antarcticibacterium sp. 1MA-6-2]UJH91141.1 OmpH family outer membrane protein [Antarcticibacterium sp. 1MA-6-2]